MKSANPPWKERLSQSLPNRDALSAHPWLRPVASPLLHPQLWRFQHEAVARGVAVGTFWAFVIPLAQGGSGGCALHLVARQYSSGGCNDDGHQPADDWFLALAGLPDRRADFGPAHGPTHTQRRWRTLMARRVWMADRARHGGVRHWRRGIGLCLGQTDLAPTRLAQTARASGQSVNRLNPFDNPLFSKLDSD